MLIGCAPAASLFPFVGTIIYLILRPPEYLEDVRERELEIQAAEARLYELDTSLCPHCDYRVERDFVRCPSCLRKLKERCVSCGRPLDQAWTICPYCETEVPPAVSRRPRRRRAPQGRKGLRIAELRGMTVSRELAQVHYAEHAERPFFGELVDFITSGPIVAMVLEGSEAVQAARQVIGATNPLEAAPGSIRGDHALEVGRNMVHGSDSPSSAEREVALFFPDT